MDRAVREHQRRQYRRALKPGGRNEAQASQYGTSRVGTSPAEQKGHIREWGGPLAFTTRPSGHQMGLWQNTIYQRRADALAQRLHRLKQRRDKLVAQLRQCREKRTACKAQHRKLSADAQRRVASNFVRRMESLNDWEGDIQLDLKATRLEITACVHALKAACEHVEQHRASLIPLRAMDYADPNYAEYDDTKFDRRAAGAYVSSSSMNWHANR